MTEVVTGKTRWRKFGIVMVPTVAGATLMAYGLSSGALAASFVVSGGQFKVSSDHLHGEHFQQFGGLDQDGVHSAPDKFHPVMVSVIKTATLDNICQSVVQPLPFGLGTVTLRLDAGGAAGTVHADDLVVDASQLTATDHATFSNIQIGRDASTLNQTTPVGQAGGFGQQADTVDIFGLQQTAWATTAGSFTLPGLSLKFGGECY